MNNPLCQFKNIFGEPGKGAHSTRFLGVAVVDVIATILVGLLIAFVWKMNTMQTAILLAGLFLMGILAHRLFCVRTAVDVWLFGEKN